MKQFDNREQKQEGVLYQAGRDINNFIFGEGKLFSREHHFRTQILARIRSTWITDYLQKTLEQDVFLKLQLQRIPNATFHAPEMIVQELKPSPLTLSDEIRPIQVYDQAYGSLLVLGEPGSGKTMLLLEIARDLLERAEHEETHAIPVVLPLATWAKKQQPLEEWIITELFRWYYLPPSLSKQSINAGLILPLLDGLDEVAEEARVDCVEAINNYSAKYAMMSPVMVSCRKNDYDGLLRQYPLQLRETILIQPLIEQQIREYFFAIPGLERVYTLIRDDESLKELMTTPLMLSILAQTYRDTPQNRQIVVPFTESLSREEQRDLLFKTYMSCMLNRRKAHPVFQFPQTMSWLSWLAMQLKQRNLTELSFDGLDSSWLPKGLLRNKYNAVIYVLIAIVAILMIGMIWLVVSLLLTYPQPPDQPRLIQMTLNLTNTWGRWIVQGLVYICSCFLLLTSLAATKHIFTLLARNRIPSSPNEPGPPKQAATQNISQPFIFHIQKQLYWRLILYICLPFVCILFSTYFCAFGWSNTTSEANFQNQCIKAGGTVGETICHVPQGASEQQAAQIREITPSTDMNSFLNGTTMGGMLGAIFCIFTGLLALLGLVPRAIHKKITAWKPNGIHQSRLRLMLTLLLSGISGLLFIYFAPAISQVVLWLTVIILSWLTNWNNILLRLFVVTGGCLAGVLFASAFGFRNKFDVFLLKKRSRFIYSLLCSAGLLPRRDFFIYASECLLLREVGKRYMFIHPLFRDYLANLYKQNTPKANKHK